ncbi:MAG TPA: glyoxalase superfamily protein [Aquella sp.]|nr:glyoxalase superfamily protein [Aquella sp.]
MQIELTKDLIKAQVKILREFLKENNIDLKQSSAYQVISKMYGQKDWNTLSTLL